jgi:CTP-dependent riboflavin kinase
MGLGLLFPGTLNVRLDADYQMQNEIVLARAEVNNVDELFLQRCRVGGIRSVLVRPYRDQPVPGWASNPPNILEIMSERRLRDALELDTGSVVEIEVEGDDAWWFSPDKGRNSGKAV